MLYSSSFRYDQARELFGLNPSSLPPGLGLENRLNFEQKHTGFNLSASYPMRIFHRIGLSYILDNSQTTGINPATQAYFSAVAAQNQNFIVGGVPNVFNARRVVPSYRIPLVGQIVSLVPFMDTGNVWVLKPAELERKIVTPGLIQTLPAQFLPGTNSGLRMSTGIEFQVVMPVLNAPFRVDFAFNPARIDENFVGPVTGTPFGIHQPSHDFKFTVGRTF